MVLQTLFSAQQCFDQLLLLTLSKLDKLQAILKQQAMSTDSASSTAALISALRQHFSASQVWLVDKTTTMSPLNLARLELETLSDLLQSAELSVTNRGAIGMIIRSLSTYANLLQNQAEHLRHQHLRHTHKAPSVAAIALH